MKRFYNGIKILGEIYPIKLVLLVFVPVIIGFIIDYNLSESRYIIINLIWILLFTIPYSVLHKKIIYQSATLVYFIIGSIEITHWIILKGPLTITSLLVISNTNYQESLEFIDLKATSWLLILVPYTLLFIYSFRHPPNHYNCINNCIFVKITYSMTNLK